MKIAAIKYRLKLGFATQKSIALYESLINNPWIIDGAKSKITITELSIFFASIIININTSKRIRIAKYLFIIILNDVGNLKGLKNISNAINSTRIVIIVLLVRSSSLLLFVYMNI